MIRGLGFLADPEDIHDAELVAWNVNGLPGISMARGQGADSFSWRPHVASIPDQLNSSSCVGQAMASSLELLGHIKGNPIPRPSAQAIYAIARLLDAPQKPLFDVGCSPSRAIEGMREHGLVAEKWLPFDVSRINDPPPWDVFQRGFDAMLAQHYRYAPGMGAAANTRSAIRAGYVPTFAMTVDESYSAYDGSDVYRVANGRVLGRHMQCVVGYGEDYFEVLNSWGDGWGDHGFARISSAFLESSAVTSWIVPTSLPLVS